MKKIILVVAALVLFASAANAGVARFGAKHVVVPVAKASVKVAKVAARTAYKIAY